MARLHLTDRTLRALTTEKAQEDFWDQNLPGFGVRVSKAGRKSFVILYRAQGRKRRMTLGAYPRLGLADARDQAKKLLGQVVNGTDPQARKLADRDAMTFEEMAEAYLELYARVNVAESTFRQDQWMLSKIYPKWRGVRAKDIKRQHVAALLDEDVPRAPMVANEKRKVISKIYNWAISRGWVEANPCHLLKAPAKPRKRERFLTASEIPKVWAAFSNRTPLMGGSFKLRLLTAQRGCECLSMRWDQIDGEWWRIPAEISKNRKEHLVYLSPQTRALLDQLRAEGDGSPWVFPSPSTSSHLTIVKDAAAQIREESGIEFTPHDLRRTAATHMADLGVRRIVISKILNHQDAGSVTHIYDRYAYKRERQEAMTLWGEHLAKLLEGVEDFGAIKPLAA